MVTTMTAVSLTQQQYQQFIDKISGLEATMATMQTHAEAQQEQIRMAEVVIQQLRANPTNPPPPLRAAFQKTGDRGWCLPGTDKVHGKPFRLPRLVLQRETSPYKRGREICWTTGQIDEVKENDVLEYRRTTDLNSTDTDWLNSELYALLAIKTSDTAMASIKSSEGSCRLATLGT